MALPNHLRRLLLALVLLGFSSQAAQARTHRVARGDTLSRIAKRYKVDLRDLKAANRLRSNRLKIGKELHIPSRGEIFVRRGETLSHIARRVHSSVEALRRANGMRRRRLNVRLGQRLTMPGHEAVKRRNWGKPKHPGQVKISRRDQHFTIQLVDEQRHVRREGLDQLSALMKRRNLDENAQVSPDAVVGEETETVKGSDEIVEDNNVVNDSDGHPKGQAHPRLALLLAKISDHFGGREVRVVSGLREVRGYTRETSRHTMGRAVDIRVSGVPNRSLWEYCRRINHAGCGYYPNSTFVHVDARRRRTQWVDWSRPGKRARYGTLRGPAGRKRRLRMPRPSVKEDLPLQVRMADTPHAVVTKVHASVVASARVPAHVLARILEATRPQ